MTVSKLQEKCSFEVICLCEPEREVKGGYCGDLLSWVMGRAKEGDAWITIMSNINVLAVASLADVSCVIFAEGVTPEADVIETAKEKGVNLLSSKLPIFETAVLLSENKNE